MAAILTLRAPRILHLLAMPTAIVVGCVADVLLGVYDFQRAIAAPWLALPEYSGWPGLSAALDEELWALLVVFLIVSSVVAVKAGNEGAIIQQVSWRRPRAIDFRAVQGTLNVSGVRLLLSAIVGILPIMIY